MSMRSFATVIASLLVVSVSANAQTWTQVAHGAKLDTTLAGEVGEILLTGPGKYLATTDAGLWRSTDGGSSWLLADLGISSSYPATFYTHPDGRIFCGTYLGGLFVSSDSGLTWNHVTGHPNLPIQRITQDSQGRLFTGCWGLTRIGGVCRSTDNGTTWTQVLDSLYVEVVEVGPGDVLYAGAGYDASGVSIGGLWRSTDAGTTWQAIYPSIGVRSVTVASDGSILMGGYSWNPTLQLHTYRSTNNGAKWAQCAGFYSEFYATDANHFIYAACDSGMRRSTDNGASWVAMNTGLLNRYGAVPWLRCLRKIGDNGLIAGEYHTGEIFRSTDLGAHWSAGSVLMSTHFVSGKLVTLAADNAGQLFMGSSAYGMLRWDAVGGLARINSGLGNLAVQVVYVGRTGNVFAGTAGGVYRSTDNGANWTKFGATAVSIRALTDLPNGAVLGGAAAGVIRFAADGSSFSLMNAGLVSKNVNAFGTGADGRSYVGTDDGLYRLDSITWAPMSISSGALKVVDIKSAAQTLVVAARDSGVYVSTNNGLVWQQKNAGISGLMIRTLAGVVPDRLYAATDSNGVYSATTGSSQWASFSQGINDPHMRGLALGSDGYLFAITDSGAILKTVVRVTSVPEATSMAPSAFALEQNYPNPFNPSTTIRYDLRNRAHVSLAVFNTLGQRVAVLQNGEQEAGYYEVKFDGRGLSSGVYFYQIKAGDFVASRRLILLK